MSEGLLGAIRHHLAEPYRLALVGPPRDIAKLAEEDHRLWFYVPLPIVYIILGTTLAYLGIYAAAEIGLGQYQFAVWSIDVLAKFVQAWALLTAACPIAIVGKVAWGLRGDS